MSPVEAMWAADRASRALGMELLDVGDGRARLRMTVRTAVERSRAGRRGVYDVEVSDGDGIVATFEGHATTLRDPSRPAAPA